MLAYFVKHRLAANILMLGLLVLGFMSSQKLPTTLLPNINVPFATISIDYEAASAEVMVKDILTELSEVLRQPAAVNNVYAEAYAGGGWLGIEFTLNADINQAMQQAQTAIEQFNWPTNVSTPNLVQEQLIEPLGWVFVSQQGDVNSLRNIAEQAKQQLTASGIAQVQVQGLPTTDLQWKPSMQDWLSLQHTPSALKQQFLRQNQQYSIGTVRGQSLQTGSDSISSQQIASLSINNTPISLLHPLDDLSQGQVNFRIDGKPAALIELNRASGMGTVQAGDVVKQWMTEFQQQYPNVYISSFMDPVNLLEGHLDLLIDNALLGLVLVLLTLFVLLNSRVAFWTAAGIPIAIIASFALLYYFADSINLFSIFALLIALGIVVDDAIVVSEQTLTYYQRGYSAQQAAILGAKRMLSPVLAAALTSIAAFSPLLFLPGAIGEMLQPLPLVIICVLAASLFECFFILPGHLHHSLAKHPNHNEHKLRQWVDRSFKQFREQQFRQFISWCMHHRLLTLISAMGLLLISLALVISGVVKFNSDLQIQPNTVELRVQFYEGTDKQQQLQFAQMITASIKQIQQQHPGLIKQHLYDQRTQRRSLLYYLELSELGERQLDNKQVVDLWKSLIGTTAQIESITSSEDTQITDRAGSTDVEFMSFLLNADNVQQLTAAIDDIKTVLQQMPELSDISDNLPRKQFALNLTANASAKQLGMDDAYLQQQALQWFNEHQVLQFERGQQQAQFVLGVNDSSTQALSFVDSIVIRTPNEQLISLSQLTQSTQNIRPGRIKLTNGRISARISARIVDDSLSSSRLSKQVNQQIIQPIADRYGIDTQFAGANESVEEIQQALQFAAPAALLLIYLVLAWLFQSWFWPLAVVAAVPFAMTGSIFGHLLLGADFTFLSILGLFGVAGIVVNDSIILIDRFRQLLDEGQDKATAIVEAACQRFRAVLLTSITTIIGLVPILFEQSVEAQIIKTMAISLAFGLLYGTLVVLIITPAFMSFAKKMSN